MPEITVREFFKIGDRYHINELYEIEGREVHPNMPIGGVKITDLFALRDHIYNDLREKGEHKEANVFSNELSDRINSLVPGELDKLQAIIREHVISTIPQSYMNNARIILQKGIFTEEPHRLIQSVINALGPFLPPLHRNSLESDLNSYLRERI